MRKGSWRWAASGLRKAKASAAVRDAARDEQLGEHQRQARLAGQGSGFFRMRFGEEPALAAAGAASLLADLIRRPGGGWRGRCVTDALTRPRRRASARRR